MDIRQLLKQVSNRGYETIDELVTQAALIIPYIAEKQIRYRVSVYPDERVIRYYISQNLVDRPDSETETRFTYKHLLQILAIKKLQAQYLPLKKIKEIIEGLDEEGLENIVIGSHEKIDEDDFLRFAPVGQRRAFKYALCEFSVPMKGESEQKNYKKVSVPEQWTRINVMDGIEINIRSDILPENSEKRKHFIERIAAKLRIFVEDEKTKEESNGR